jgi:hypothetical protein
MRNLTSDQIDQIHRALNETILSEYDRGLINNEPVVGHIYFKHEILNGEPHNILILKYYGIDEQGDYVFIDHLKTRHTIGKNVFPYQKIEVNKDFVHEIFISET